MIRFSNFVVTSSFEDSNSTSYWLDVEGKREQECFVNITEKTLDCFLPSGEGVQRQISLVRVSEVLTTSETTASQEFDTHLLGNCVVNYAEPEIDNVDGCSTNGCQRQGGDRITIQGNNFGSRGALVFVNGEEAENITTQSHQNLVVTMPGLSTWQSQVNTVLVVRGIRARILILSLIHI